MSINVVGANLGAYTPAARPQPEAGEAQRTGREIRADGDADDAAAAKASAAPAPVVNLNGHVTGSRISVSA